MYRVSDLLSKPLITLADARDLGTVGNIYFDLKLKRGKFVELFVDEESDKRFIPLDKIKFGVDAAVIMHDGALSQAPPDFSLLAPNPINALGFNPDGKALGRVTDVLLDGVTVGAFVIGETEFAADLLLSYSQNILIVNDTGRPVKLVKRKALRPAPTPQPAPASVSPAPQPAPSFTLPETLRSAADAPPPKDTVYNFLLGKTVTAPVYATSGATVIPIGTIITPEVIDRARAENVLVRLALHAR